jgi:hypothetical protein
VALGGFVPSFVLLHWTIARATNIPEIQLHESEGEAIADSLGRLLKFYDVPALNEKMEAWVGFISALAQVYGPRGMAIYERVNRPPPSELQQRPDGYGPEAPIELHPAPAAAPVH